MLKIWHFVFRAEEVLGNRYRGSTIISSLQINDDYHEDLGTKADIDRLIDPLMKSDMSL